MTDQELRTYIAEQLSECEVKPVKLREEGGPNSLRYRETLAYYTGRMSALLRLLFTLSKEGK